MNARLIIFALALLTAILLLRLAITEDRLLLFPDHGHGEQRQLLDK
jgi:hypothetical protein